jgi:hypothetical protein
MVAFKKVWCKYEIVMKCPFRRLEKNEEKDSVNPNVAKAGGLQSQGVKGEAVIGYRNPLTTRDLKSSSSPGR